MVNVAAAFGVSFIISALAGLVIIPMLRRFKLKQQILEIGPKWHMSKQGTPMMGGLIFILGTVVACVALGLLGGYTQWILVLSFALLNSAVGVIDDIAKIKKKKNQGLSVLQKLFLQLAFSAAFIAALQWMGMLSNSLTVPILGLTIKLPWILFLIVNVLYNTFIVNGVNFTDGIDGLLSGTTLPIALFFMTLAVTTQSYGGGIFPAALAGGLFGFLIYNFHPAKVFMGDTGSLFLGGAVCGMAMAADKPLVLLIVGLFYIIEALSVVLQVGYFKLSGGKRLFKMAPIHHHFEMKGWSEIKLFCVFTAGTLLLCGVAWVFR